MNENHPYQKQSSCGSPQLGVSLAGYLPVVGSVHSGRPAAAVMRCTDVGANSEGHHDVASARYEVAGVTSGAALVGVALAVAQYTGTRLQPVGQALAGHDAVKGAPLTPAANFLARSRGKGSCALSAGAGRKCSNLGLEQQKCVRHVNYVACLTQTFGRCEGHSWSDLKSGRRLWVR